MKDNTQDRVQVEWWGQEFGTLLQEVDEKSFGQARALRGIVQEFSNCKKLAS